MDGVTISLLTHTPVRQLLCASRPAALRLEELQFTLGEGPCIDAARDRVPVLVADLHGELTRWPLFGACARELLPQVGAVYGFPLLVGGQALGAVDLIRDQPAPADPPFLRRAELAVQAVAQVLLPVYRRLLADEEAPPWEPTDMIATHWGATYRAAGMLAVRRGITVLEALDRMRAEAFVTGRPLSAIAADLLDPPPTSDG